MTRPIKPESAGRYRKPPHDEDWLRAQLQDLVPQDLKPGDDLTPIIEDLPSEDYKRLMNRWRVRQHRRYGKKAFQDGKFYHDIAYLSPLWRKAIDMGLIKEADALAICWECEERGFPRWSDTGATVTIRHILEREADACRKNLAARSNAPGNPYYGLDPASPERAKLRREMMFDASKTATDLAEKLIQATKSPASAPEDPGNSTKIGKTSRE